MEQKVVKLGVVGVISRGRSVVSNVIGDKNVKIAAICDINPNALQNAYEALTKQGAEDIACYASYDEMLASDIDAVFIATDAPTHTAFAIKALNAGKHVLSEIPAVWTPEEAKALKATVEAHPELKYMCAENCCYWAFIQAWKKMYEDGKFGEAVFCESEYLHAADLCDIPAVDPTPEHWRRHMPAIRYLTHNLGPLLYILDDKCVSVTCMESDIVYNPHRKASATGCAMFKTAKGTIIKILICFGAYIGCDHNFSIYGTHGMIETDRRAFVTDAHSFARFSDIPGSFGEKIDIPVTTAFPGENKAGHGGADGKMVREFIKCIIDDTKPPIDIDLGIRMSLAGWYAHESAVNGGAEIKIPDLF